MRTLVLVLLHVKACVAALLIAGCGIIMPVRHATHGGIEIVYPHYEGDYRLPREKVREVDERWAALMECIPPEARCRHSPPDVEIRAGDCDSFVSQGVRVRGETVFLQRVAVPGSLGALAHEWSHLVACEYHHNGPWTRVCGDRIDGEFRRKYPPRKCEGEK